MNVDKNGSVAKASAQNMAFLFKWEGEDDNKESWTIFEKHHPDKSNDMTSIVFSIFAPAHDLNHRTLLCWVEAMWSDH